MDTFIVFRDWMKVLQTMTKEQAADCFFGIADYCLNGNDRHSNDPVVEMFLTIAKGDSKRSIERYKAAITNGKKGGRPSKYATEEERNQARKEQYRNYNQKRKNTNNNDFTTKTGFCGNESFNSCENSSQNVETEDFNNVSNDFTTKTQNSDNSLIDSVYHNNHKNLDIDNNIDIISNIYNNNNNIDGNIGIYTTDIPQTKDSNKLNKENIKKKVENPVFEELKKRKQFEILERNDNVDDFIRDFKTTNGNNSFEMIGGNKLNQIPTSQLRGHTIEMMNRKEYYLSKAN